MCEWELKLHLMSYSSTLRVHDVLPRSHANGPGVRAVVWLQGCSIGCRGCFNPTLHDPGGGNEMSVSGLTDWIFSMDGIDGITISGGEPTDQMPSLISLLHDIRYFSGLSVILFSGRTMREIECMHRGRELLSLTDVLIDGPYVPTKANLPGVWPASANQSICLLTERYSPGDFAGIPPFEVFIGRKGGIVVSGMGGFTGLRVSGMK